MFRLVIIHPLAVEDGTNIKCKIMGVMEMQLGFLQTSVVLAGIYWSLCIHVQVKLTLEQATKTQRGSRGIALLFL
jgi:hypothetical protein